MLMVAQGQRTPAQIDATIAVMDGITDRVPEFVCAPVRGPQDSQDDSARELIGLAVLLVISVILSYNRFVRQRTLADESWGDIDVELSRRHDLIPNLVETVQGYATHEREVLEQLVRAREAAAAHRRTDRTAARGSRTPSAWRCVGAGAGRGLPRPQGELELPGPAAPS